MAVHGYGPLKSFQPHPMKKTIKTLKIVYYRNIT